jgi:hypothetical protein
VPKPVLQALVLADNVYQDKATGKKIIAGTFNRLFISKPKPTAGGVEKPASEESPAAPRGDVRRMGSPTAYISLIDCHGVISLELRYVDLSDDKVLMRATIPIKCDDPLNTVEAIVPVPPLPVPHAGIYTLELLSNDEPLGALRITVVETPDT